MSTNNAIGMVLIVVGGILLYVGFNSTNSLADQVSNTFTGRFTERTTWYLIGGGAAVLLGAALFFRGRSRMA